MLVRNTERAQTVAPRGDPQNRIYRGLDPRLLPQDRVESVTFHHKGIHLVVCGLVPHFREGMAGFVKVV